MNMNGKSDRIDEELVCVDSLVQRLREIDSGVTIDVHREPKDPPDFWITVAGTKYAVEVTSIVTDQGYHALCDKFLKSIRAESDADNDIDVKGTYAIQVMRRPDIPRRTSTHWKNLVSTAIEHIRGMSTAATGAKVNLLKDANGYLALIKLSDNGSAIGLIRHEAKWEGTVQEELPQLFQNAIDAKRAKIEKKGVLALCPNVILLLYDAYTAADIEEAQKAFLKVPGYEWLHSIFWAASFSDRQNELFPDSPGRTGMFLYSKNGEWREEA